MRKIKFRAWITDSWDEEDNPVYEMCYDLAFEEYAPINDLLGSIDTLMQFTGLYDKNGKEIWEGDILKADDSNYGYGGDYDKSHDGYVYFVVPSITEMLSEDFIWYSESFKYHEVIGNIYENPKEGE